MSKLPPRPSLVRLKSGINAYRGTFLKLRHHGELMGVSSRRNLVSVQWYDLHGTPTIREGIHPNLLVNIRRNP